MKPTSISISIAAASLAAASFTALAEGNTAPGHGASTGAQQERQNMDQGSPARKRDDAATRYDMGPIGNVGGASDALSRSGANTTSGASTGAAGDRAEAARDAQNQVMEAAQVLQKMQSDASFNRVLQQASGVFILPKYGRVALGIGARGGEGVLFTRRNGQWSSPAFYNIGGVSAGFQAGIEGGNIAMVLNNQKALNSFRQENNWSLNADAGLTIVQWSGRGQASVGKGDIIVWSDTAGLLGDLAISVTDIRFDNDETRAYYGRQVTLGDLSAGQLKDPHAARWQQALGRAAQSSGRGASTSAGGTQSGANESGKANSSR